MFKSLTFCLLILLLQSTASAATLYVSPEGSGSGYSESSPCALDSAITMAQAGDEIYLRNGFYGDLRISGQRNSGNITIAAQPGHNPGVRSVVVSGSRRWTIRGLEISPELTSPYVRGSLVNIHPDCDNITIEDNDLYYTRDSSGWSASDWTSIPERYAILTEGTNIVIRNNNLKNVYLGLKIREGSALVENNTIENIGGDAISINTNNVTLKNNTLKNFYKIDGNHDDGIQGHRGGDGSTPIENITISGNLIISREPHLTNPLLGDTQGILADNTPLINWIVENNVIITNHWHGISLYGASDSRVVNNIVFNPTFERGIRISFNNQGRNCVVRNNIAANYYVGGTNVVADHNIDIDDYNPEELFVDYRNYDLRHRAGSPAIDAGSATLAPSTDINGNRRPQGSGYDIGAYEYGSGGSPPPPNVLYGDVSENGSISAYDASLAAQYTVGSIGLSLDQITKADVTGNGSVSASDASWIARKAVDPGVAFPVE